MNIVRYTKLGVVSAISLGALFGASEVGVGFNNVAHAQDVTVPANGEAYKSIDTDYQLNIQPKITNSDGATYTLGGGEYTITQFEEYDAKGMQKDVTGAEGVKLTLTKGGSNIATVSEDGSYYLQNTVRVPGYLLDTKRYQYTFPNGIVNAENQVYDVVPKLEIADDEFVFTKTSEDDNTPLQGVEFDIYQTRSEALQEDFADGGKKVGSAVTGTDGKVKTGTLEEGKYYLVETKTAEGHALDTSKIYFEVGVQADGRTTFAREIDAESDLVNTKDHFLNYILPTLDKKVGIPKIEPEAPPGGEIQLFDETQPVNYMGTIYYSIDLVLPKDLGRYTEFKLTDTFDARLNGELIPELTSFTSNDTNEPLLMNNDYTISVEGNVATVNFTKSGRERLAQGNVKFSYYTHINRGSEVKTGDLLNNKIVMNYDNGLGQAGEVEDSVDVELKEGVLQINKVNGRTPTEKLDGAKFKLYEEVPLFRPMKVDPRMYGDNFGLEGDGELEFPVPGGELPVPSDEFGPPTMGYGKDYFEIGEKAYSLVHNPETGEPYEGTTVDGKVVFKDIPFGTYYAFETEAPEGYNLNKTPLEVKIQDTNTTIDGIEDGVILSVDNYKRTDNLPATGTIGLMFIGGVTVAAALGAMATRRKLKEDEDLEETTVK